ncbi:hypothetical protein CRUP_012091 [Coryphaenoides rupestris]|nr:hypothetical protein CRUP_012091 [Coryphaenoides rupestris]
MMMMEEEEVLSRPPIPPITIRTSPVTGRPVKTPGKPRKPRAPKASTPVSTPVEKAPRKPRARTPKVDKIMKPAAAAAAGAKPVANGDGAVVKPKGVPRKRKKPVKEEAKDASAVTVGPPADGEEVDPITAIIEAVLARAVADTASDSEESLKKPRKKAAKKQGQDGGAAKEKPTNGGSQLRSRWRREIRVRQTESRMKGETWYYTPCGRRMKQFPEIIKHFSFSPRMPIGDFYEERETSEPRRVRAPKGGPGGRRPGRPPKPKMVDLLSKVDAKLLKRLEAKEALTEEDKEKMAKIKKKMKRKARLKRKEDADNKKLRDEKKKAKASESTQQEAPKKPGRRRRTKAPAPAPVQQTDEERIAQGKRVLGARSKAKALAKAQAEAEAAAQAAMAAKRAAERQLSRVPGVVLSGAAFAHCLTVVEFLHGYGRVIGLNIPRDIPSLATLQEGLLGLGEGQGEVQDLLMKLLEAALHDPGLTSYYQSRGFDVDVCDALRTKTFHTLPPDTKASVLGFLVEELNASNIVISDIDNTLENMAAYRKNKWTIEGKLRKLKAALARRTGRSEEELCLEERRRSNRVVAAEEEEVLLGPQEESQERASRRSATRKEEQQQEQQQPKLSDRQQLFRKKLLQSSHSMRAVSLGQDRFRRRYLALPHLGAILVEGPEELLASEEVLVAEVPVTLLKREPKVEEMATPTASPTTPALTAPPSAAGIKSQATSSPVEDNRAGEPGGEEEAEAGLPGTASLMSQPRARGRPRKIKPEVELHLRTAKMVRRRRSRSGGPGLPGATAGVQLDLTQAAFQSWLSQTQESTTAITNGTSTGDQQPGGQGPEDSVRETAERRGQWFNLLPKEPCDAGSLTEPQAPPEAPGPATPRAESALPGQSPTEPVTTTPPPGGGGTTTSTAPQFLQLLPLPLLHHHRSLLSHRRPRPHGPGHALPARPAAEAGQPGEQPRPAGSGSQRGRQAAWATAQLSMVRGWWCIRDAEELQATLSALNPRGVREKSLHKHLAKHMDSLGQMCTKPPNDPIFQVKVEEEEDDALMEALQQPWQVQDRVLEVDIGALQWVEELEQRVITADLHFKVAPESGIVKAESAEVDPDLPVVEFEPYTAPEADSTRSDLRYYEHQADPRDDWTVRTKREWSDVPRVVTHPLDLAVLRLANLERHVQRRYLKEPLWNAAEVMRLAPVTPTPGEAPPMDVMSLESEITPRLRTWRQALDRCRSAPQLCLCILQLEKAIAWERSVVKVESGGVGGDQGAAAVGSGQRQAAGSKKRTRLKKRRYEDDSSDEESARHRRSVGMATRHKDAPATGTTTTSSSSSSSSSSRYCGDGAATGISPAKRRRMTTRNQPDLTYCEIILMEMEAHTDAWPFLEPVNPRLVPGYRRIVKNPMDFLTMRERLLQGGYCNCEEFAADAQLVFNNCELFNEDTSEVGVAGHAMRRFFESRWAEFYDGKEK